MLAISIHVCPLWLVADLIVSIFRELLWRYPLSMSPMGANISRWPVFHEFFNFAISWRYLDLLRHGALATRTAAGVDGQVRRTLERCLIRWARGLRSEVDFWQGFLSSYFCPHGCLVS